MDEIIGDAIVGIEFHTFSLVGRCQRTGALGVAITTSDVAVGSRCPFVKPLVGAVSTQASTDPRLGPFALQLLNIGYSSTGAIQQLASSDPHIDRRQLGLVDREGNSAARTGAHNNPWAGHIANNNYVSMGNGLAGQQVVDAMAEAFELSEPEDLEERLLRAIEAGQQAGGEARDSTPYHSAALLVYASDTFSRIDLRVDDHPTPIVELRRVFEIYQPRIDYFSLRASDPAAAAAEIEAKA
ncbi:MAG: DUF1028 domain-containing protein [Chloroflexi bacterium]|nr:DUF1028 domain-containing protein [Chloroflexota bacterium]